MPVKVVRLGCTGVREGAHEHLWKGVAGRLPPPRLVMEQARHVSGARVPTTMHEHSR
jgi:hypothetical protein